MPAYNEEEALPAFYHACSQALSSLGRGWEILFVDDGSTDGTLDVMRSLAHDDPNVHYLSLSRNFGKEAAMYAGLRNAQGSYVAIMDADLQDPPELLARMVEVLDAGEYDCVAAYREDRAGEPVLRSTLSRSFYRLMSRLSDTEVKNGARDYRLMTRRMVDAVLSLGERNRFSKGIFSWVGFKTMWLPYANVERVTGTTKWTLSGLARYSIDGLVNFSQAPLAIASTGGLILTLLSFVLIVFIFIRKLAFGDPVAGWASTVCIISFIGGIQLLCLGIIGQYLAKTYIETKERPHYFIAESNCDDADMIG